MSPHIHPRIRPDSIRMERSKWKTTKNRLKLKWKPSPRTCKHILRVNPRSLICCRVCITENREKRTLERRYHYPSQSWIQSFHRRRCRCCCCSRSLYPSAFHHRRQCPSHATVTTPLLKPRRATAHNHPINTINDLWIFLEQHNTLLFTRNE